MVTYKGVKFGGAMGWYDGSYKNIPREEVAKIWRGWSDCLYIKGLETYDTLFKPEYSKLESINNKVDIMVSHFNPSSDILHHDQHYINDPCSSFFGFNGKKLLENTSAKYWVYGHTHNSKHYKVNNCQVINNPYGYFDESKGRKLSSFIVKV